jgi:hypothetical protein
MMIMIKITVIILLEAESCGTSLLKQNPITKPCAEPVKFDAYLCNLTNQLIPWSRILLEKLVVTQLVKKFRTFYGNRRFIIVFTRAPKPDGSNSQLAALFFLDLF